MSTRRSQRFQMDAAEQAALQEPDATQAQTVASGGRNLDDIPPPTPLSTESMASFPPLERLNVGPLYDEFVRTFVRPLTFPRLYAPLKLKNALLYGPPGTGKTMIARGATKTLATMLGTEVPLFVAKNLKGAYSGGTARRIDAYYRAAQAAAPEGSFSVVFVDEIESLVPKRTSNPAGAGAGDAVTAFLQALDGIETFPNVITLAATNIPWDIDTAILSRFPLKWFVDMPNNDASAVYIRDQFQYKYLGVERSPPGSFLYQVNILLHNLLAPTQDAIMEVARKVTQDPKDTLDFLKAQGHVWLLPNMQQYKNVPKMSLGYSYRDMDSIVSRIIQILAERKLGMLVSQWSEPARRQVEAALRTQDLNCTIIPTPESTICQFRDGQRDTVFGTIRLFAEDVELMNRDGFVLRVVQQVVASVQSSIKLEEYVRFLQYAMFGF